MFFINTDTDSTIDKFDMSRFMDYQNHYDPFWSYLFNKIQLLPAQGSYRIDTEEGRPELLSYNLYETTKYWWLLLVYNRKICPFDLKQGEYIKYPSIITIDRVYMYLRDLQSEHNKNVRYL